MEISMTDLLEKRIIEAALEFANAERVEADAHEDAQDDLMDEIYGPRGNKLEREQLAKEAFDELERKRDRLFLLCRQLLPKEPS